ncbi:MAG: HAMP domain-containing protein [Chitinivibrionales bacterium]|nr:HAMP domain-containing protein [Chitinivibrionales bacterium]MBD3356835.1 HAMP domain-containing protein [Chitinivibrionales bacterium]
MRPWRRLELEWKVLLLASVIFAAFAWPVQRLYIARLTTALQQSIDPRLEPILRSQLKTASAADSAAIVGSIERNRQWRALIPMIVAEQQQSIFVFSFVLSAVLFLFALWTLKRLTRPLKNLAVAVEAIGRGKRAQIQAASGGALGTLEQAVIEMQDELDVLRERARVQGMETAWQEIARVMAHEIKNPLTPIRLSLDAMEEKIATGGGLSSEVMKRHLGRINAQTDNLERLVNQFRSFSREPELRLRALSIREPIEVVAHDMASRVVTTVDGNAVVMADLYLLNQLLLNVWKNALEAGADTIAVTIRPGAAEGHTATPVRIVIADNGPGISKNDLERVWLPYVTLKKGGTGLGLPVVRKLVETMNGSVYLESAPGRGLTVIITLPPATGGD